ncbi:galactosylgalactosylxylosylprotein 3-beta-glucuronosyltransferase I [Ceratitis capitata]|uniref:Galactosylgalactosylxylosylprotein 3-beta-glucuronosyltransferase n=1 Tax=Ceratitis capitata TaxID=7213 RepID=W8BQG1_CERCA|nr:galactosylgalactosylxylosylprotein 3-beta-glucuronosyltransferase I [Ceratitis capitata]
MSEMRIRPRQVLILIIVFLVILLIVHRNGKHTCQGPEFLQAIYARDNEKSLPKIYAITPTYTRPSQKAELTRLSHIFMLLSNLHWVIIEDANTTTPVVRNLLRQAGLSERSTHLNIKTPVGYKLKNKDPNWLKPRGVEQRNLALNWIRTNVNPEQRSVIFFMDDDNSYSVELFVEMMKIEPGRVGVWPVGLVGGLMVEKPILNEDNTHVIGFNAAWRPERPFPIDMAAFAISTDLLFKYPQAQFAYEVERGYQESEILRHITTREKLQPLANNCRDVLVWHTRTEKTNLVSEVKLNKEGKRSDEGMEV